MLLNLRGDGLREITFCVTFYSFFLNKKSIAEHGKLTSTHKQSLYL